ncbi:hypothetical protein Btru_054529 [Bulinus truncatus]|nr:hypothetical protein Btru_054529 [Bulinus truncatus]
MEHSNIALVLAFLSVVVCCVCSEELAHASGLNTLDEHDESHQSQKRSPSSPAVFTEDLDTDNGLDEHMDDLDKRNTLFRFGKRQGAWFRYGKRGGTLLRFGKRGTLLRFGKRAGSLFRFGRSGRDVSADSDNDKRTLFRFGKRSDLEELLREAVEREELNSNSPWYLDNDLSKRQVNGFHWGSDSDE